MEAPKADAAGCAAVAAGVPKIDPVAGAAPNVETVGWAVEETPNPVG